jgi:hypothetical protein
MEVAGVPEILSTNSGELRSEDQLWGNTLLKNDVSSLTFESLSIPPLSLSISNPPPPERKSIW